LGVSRGVVSKVDVVLRHASDLVDPVISGATGLDEAYAVAQEDPEPADRVVEGGLGTVRSVPPRVPSPR
jgi:hypothetical protein